MQILFIHCISFSASVVSIHSIIQITLHISYYMNLFLCLWFNATFNFILHIHQILCITLYTSYCPHLISCIWSTASHSIHLISCISFYASHSIYFILLIFFNAFCSILNFWTTSINITHFLIFNNFYFHSLIFIV